MKDSSGAIWSNYREAPYRFANTEEAQAFLDTVKYKSEIEWVQAPHLFRLLNGVGAPLTNWREIINQVDTDFGREVDAEESIFRHPESFERRGALLAVFKSVMDLVEGRLAGEDREKFREARLHHYKVLITQEAVVNGNVCVETLYQVTTREIAAGRMPTDFPQRQIAEQGMAASHFTRDELLAGAADDATPADGRSTTPEPHGLWRRTIRFLRTLFPTAAQREENRRKSLGYD
jgi:hypothetical protein